ncbi:uncharacterized protein Bfra_001245 [Botrytis fragariae]|uniref:Uncharacterized protein n=1 Tax=Botrytis fragariae TaxID=1964551 RepID=A0A8H6B0G8_9HELO|nr:uncharacterized protein Bfra_001245 [Botrytis fragariae]KAF5876890.1 hypothetical protein Bfra_001245 [Botrytis fragariae]
MPPKKEPQSKPKPNRANNELRAERKRLAAIAAHAAAVRAEREQERLRMQEGEVEEEERLGASAQNPSGTGGFWVGGDEHGVEEGERDLAGGSAGISPSIFSGLTHRPKNAQMKEQRQKQNERRKAYRRKVRKLKREAAKEADAKIVKGMARLRIAERIAAGEDVAFDEDEDEEEEDRIWTTVLGNWSLPDEDDEDDVCEGTGGLGGPFGGGSGGTGGQGVNQLLLSGN